MSGFENFFNYHLYLSVTGGVFLSIALSLLQSPRPATGRDPKGSQNNRKEKRKTERKEDDT